MVQFYMLQLDCFSALLHIINIPPAPWCITRCALYFDTQLDWILPWADINRNGNIFFHEFTAHSSKKAVSQGKGRFQAKNYTLIKS